MYFVLVVSYAARVGLFELCFGIWSGSKLPCNNMCWVSPGKLCVGSGVVFICVGVCLPFVCALCFVVCWLVGWAWI